MQGVAPRVTWTYCLIHPEALASQQFSSDLNEVLEIVVKIVNFIKTRFLNTRFSQRLCDKLGAEHNNLLFYCNSRWLSEGKVPFRVCKLRSEIIIFLKEEKHSLVTTFENGVFQSKLRYLCDIFEKLNQLNISLQGRDTHILQLHDKHIALKGKLRLWKTGLFENGEQCNNFPIQVTI